MRCKEMDAAAEKIAAVLAESAATVDDLNNIFEITRNNLVVIVAPPEKMDYLEPEP